MASTFMQHVPRRQCRANTNQCFTQSIPDRERNIFRWSICAIGADTEHRNTERFSQTYSWDITWQLRATPFFSTKEQTNNKQQTTTNNKQQTTNNQQPATNNKQQTHTHTLGQLRAEANQRKPISRACSATADTQSAALSASSQNTFTFTRRSRPVLLSCQTSFNAAIKHKLERMDAQHAYKCKSNCCH